MVRSSGSHRPAGRRLALVVGILAALVVPLAAVSADEGGPPEPSGRSMASFSEAICGSTSCVSIEFGAREVGPDRSICVGTLTTTLDEQTILEQEFGCAETNVGAWRTSGGFITGVQDTSVTLESTLGTSRTVTVSAATALAGAISPTIEVVTDTIDNCTFTWTIRERRVPVAGTVTVGGVTFATGSDSISTIRQVKEKQKCA